MAALVPEDGFQECGPLARTNMFEYPGSYFLDGRETVNGDACEGEQWDEKFDYFCPIQEAALGHCNVQGAFNTDWHVRGAVGSGQYAGSVFSCSNFPAIPDTVVSAHSVEVSNGSVTYDAAHGILYGTMDWSDYDFAQNGIVNAAVDIGVLAHPLGASVRSFSWALAVYLLSDEANVVTS